MDRASPDLFRRAFGSAPDPEYLYPAAGHRMAERTITYGIAANSPICALTGGPGTGKTLLARALSEKLRGERQVGMIGQNGAELAAPLQWVLRAFDQPSADVSAGELLARIGVFLHFGRARNLRFLLIVDEAHTLSTRALEQLQQLATLQQDGETLLPILMIGENRLAARLAMPESHDLRRQTYGPITLPPLGGDEIAPYLAHRLSIAGHPCNAATQPFEPDGIDVLFAESKGVPRIINHFARRALLAANAAGRERLDASFLQQALNNDAEAEADPLASQDQPMPPPQADPTQRPRTISATRPDWPSEREVTPSDALLESLARSIPARRRHGLVRTPIIAAALAAGILVLGVAPLPKGVTPGSDPRLAVSALPPPRLPRLERPTAPSEPRDLMQRALELGVEDPGTALLLYEQAALLGNPRAAYYLGQFFESGTGVEADPWRARAWYAMAREISGAGSRLEALSTLQPEPGPFASPVPAFQRLDPSGRTELHWRRGTGTAPARYVVEYRLAGDDAEIRRLETDLTAVAIRQPVTRWRVIALDDQGRESGASGWSVPIPAPR